MLNRQHQIKPLQRHCFVSESATLIDFFLSNVSLLIKYVTNPSTQVQYRPTIIIIKLSISWSMCFVNLPAVLSNQLSVTGYLVIWFHTVIFKLSIKPCVNAFMSCQLPGHNHVYFRGALTLSQYNIRVETQPAPLPLPTGRQNIKIKCLDYRVLT